MNREYFKDQMILLKDDPFGLGSFLIRFSKSTEELSMFEKDYASYLGHPHFYVRKGAVFGLLFKMQLKNEIYRNIALNFINDNNEDEELRSWSMTSIASAYFGSEDIEIATVLYKLFKDDSQDKYLRKSALLNLLQIYNINYVEIDKRIAHVPDTLNAYADIFQKEIAYIEKKISK